MTGWGRFVAKIKLQNVKQKKVVSMHTNQIIQIYPKAF